MEGSCRQTGGDELPTHYMVSHRLFKCVDIVILIITIGLRCAVSLLFRSGRNSQLRRPTEHTYSYVLTLIVELQRGEKQ